MKIFNKKQLSAKYADRMLKNINNRLEYLREQIRKENISYSELFELQSLSEYIDKSDIELLEWAGVKE